MLWKVSDLCEFGRQMLHIPKTLTAEEELVIDVVEPLHNPLRHGSASGMKNHFHPKIQAEANKQAQAAGIAVRSAKRQFVIDLQTAGNTQPLPGAPHGLNNMRVSLACRCRQGHRITTGVDDMDAVQPTASLQVSRAHQIELMHGVGVPRASNAGYAVPRGT